MIKINSYKKFLNIFLLIFILKTPLFADTFFSKNKTYSGEITVLGKKFQLLEGEWSLAHKYVWYIIGVQGKGFTLIQTEGNKIKAHISMWTITSPGKKEGLIGTILYKERINNNHDPCTDRSEYYLTKLWSEGASANCLKVRHIDVKKEMFSPDYNEEAQGYKEPYNLAGFKNFIRKNNLEIPKILISQTHMFYSPLLGGKGMLIYIDRNPEFFGAGKTLIGDEASSEYHKNNLSKYPKKERFVKDIINSSFIYHSELEEKFKFRKYQRLKLGNTSKVKIKTDNKSVVEELEKLNKLYRSGAITKDEFNSAKKIILNN